MKKITFTKCFPLLVIMTFFLSTFFFKNNLMSGLNYGFSLISGKLGWLYILGTLVCFIFLVTCFRGKRGQIVLGDCAPEFNTFSWISMIFCSGVGAGLVFWSMVEWSKYYIAPPHGIEPGSISALEWSSIEGLFHLSPLAWSLYCLPSVLIAYAVHNKKRPFLFSSIINLSRFKSRYVRIYLSSIVDASFIIAIIGGAAYSLFLTVQPISISLIYLFGEADTHYLSVGILLISACIFALSAFLGLHKGVTRLSNFNIILVALFILSVLLNGDTGFIIKNSISSLGLMLNNILVMATWLDPFHQSGTFTQDWTITYWAWWLAYSPFVGLFIARISKGRTIKELVFAMLVCGSTGTMLCYMVLEGHSMSLIVNNLVSMSFFADASNDAIILKSLQELPWHLFHIVIFCAICFIFNATTYDSVAYVIASTADKTQTPSSISSLLWAFALILIPISLIYMDNTHIIRAILMIASLPIAIILLVATVQFIQSTRANPEPINSQNKNKVLVFD